MSDSLSRRKWFKSLRTAASISLDMLDRCIADMSMRQLSRIKVENVMDVALIPNGHDACSIAAAQALAVRMSLCGLVNAPLAAGYRRRRHASRPVLNEIDHYLGLMRLAKISRS